MLKANNFLNITLILLEYPIQYLEFNEHSTLTGQLITNHYIHAYSYKI